MRRFGSRIVPWFGALVFLVATAPGALAQCGSAPKPVKPAVWNLQNGGAHFEFAGMRRNHDDDDAPTIVGLWHTNYTATRDENFPPGNPAPTPFPFIQSYKTWHADGTEWENAFLPPAGGNVCYGVWKETGRGTFKLHHIGLMFDPASGAVSNIFTVDEVDVVDRDGKTYRGTFEFKLFDATNVLGVGVPISDVKGTIAATRITVD